MARRVNALAVLLLALALPAWGEGLPDPTRPALTDADGTRGEPIASGPRVTLIRIAGPRRTAIVDGEEVTVGSRIQGRRVVRIAEDEVVLRGPDGVERLRLFPDVEKRPASRPASSRQKKTDRSASRKAQP
jgi:hypothetical protein